MTVCIGAVAFWEELFCKERLNKPTVYEKMNPILVFVTDDVIVRPVLSYLA